MSATKIHSETIEKLLSAITMTIGEDGARQAFFFGKPGAPHWEQRLGIEIYWHFSDLTIAALFVRSNGPAYLRCLSIGDISSKLQSFISDNYWYLSNETFGAHRDEPLNEWISKEAKSELAQALSFSTIFRPKTNLNLFPLVPIVVKERYISDVFLLSSPDDENPFELDNDALKQHFEPKRFPPQKSFEGPVKFPQSWLGVFAPDEAVALKVRAPILGAMSLTTLQRYRYMFSGREVFGGHSMISDDGTTYSFGPPHTPPCMYDIEIGETDKPWLDVLSKKITSSDRGVRREIKALEYFYRAWEKAPVERFPIMCMALDALYGDANNATQAVIDGIRRTLGEHVSDPQLRLLMKLRASVVHGGAPDVYDSSKYAKYYKTYRADPISELELVTSACLKEKVFGSKMRTHEDPNAEVIREAQSRGRLPKRLKAQSILNE